MEERAFWRTMNPRRLHALLDSWYQLRQPQKPQQEEPKSLSRYLRGE